MFCVNSNHWNWYSELQEEFADTKGVIRIRKSKKNRKINGQKKKDKRTNNEQTGGKLRCFGIVSSSCSCYCRVNLVTNPMIVYLTLSVICVVFLWSVSIDKAYLNVLVVISKLLSQSILGMRQLPRMNILVLKKRLVASSKSIIREKVNVIFITIVNKAFSVWPYYFNNQHPLKPKW